MVISLGDKVRDRMSGFSGIAVARHDFLYGCARISIQPEKLGKDGKVQEAQAFDEPQIELIKPAAFKTHIEKPSPAAKPGGPQKLPPPRATPSR